MYVMSIFWYICTAVQTATMVLNLHLLMFNFQMNFGTKCLKIQLGGKHDLEVLGIVGI